MYERKTNLVLQSESGTLLEPNLQFDADADAQVRRLS